MFRKDQLQFAALIAGVLAVPASVFFGLDWVGDQLELSPEAKAGLIIGGMAGLGALCWYIGFRLRTN